MMLGFLTLLEIRALSLLVSDGEGEGAAGEEDVCGSRGTTRGIYSVRS